MKKEIGMKRNVLLLGLLMLALILTGCRHRDKPAPVSPAEGDPAAVAEKPDDASANAAEEPEAPGLPVMETSLDDYPLSTPTDDVLVLVNKTHPVTRDYVADDLVTVEHCDPNVGTKDTKKMRKVAADAIEELIAGAKEDGYGIVMRTGYRSYDYQEYLFDSYASKYGEAEANTYSARPGQSEHQTGWCCDVGVLGVALTNVQDGYNFLESVFSGFGTALGFSLAIILLASIRYRINEEDLPKPLRGAPIVLIAAALMSIAFMGFSGLSF